MSDVPQPPGPPPSGGYPPPPGYVPPGGGYPPPPGYMVNPQVAAAARTDVPGILLIVVGALNILGMLVMFFLAVQFRMMPEALLEAEIQRNPQLSQMAASGQLPPAAELKQLYSTLFGTGGGLSVVSSILILMAGIKMRQLRAYGLSVVGALAAAVPCVSCVGCCGIGQIAGIWALMILLSEEVRAAFQAAGATGNLPIYRGGPPAPWPGQQGPGTPPQQGGITTPGSPSPPAPPPPSPPQDLPWERPDQSS